MNSAPGEAQEISVVALVAQSREAVMQAIAEYTGFAVEDLWEISETVAVMQSIPPQLLTDVGLATLGQFAKDRGVEKDSDLAQDFYAGFDKVIAANIAAATNVVLQQLREQHARQVDTQRKLSAGLLGH